MSGSPASDLQTVIQLGLARGGHLLSAGEATIARRIGALRGDAATVYARLTGRVGEIYNQEALHLPGIDDPGPALDHLVGLELVGRSVTWRERASASTVRELAAGCAALGLPRTGRKADLVARLADRAGWRGGRWFRVRHRALIRRLERWAFLSRHVDRSRLMVERLGHARWPTYEPTGGPGVHPDRRRMLAWEALLSSELDLDPCLDALAHGTSRAAGALDLTRRLTRTVAEVARTLEQTDPHASCSLYERLAHTGHPADPVRHARAIERSGRPDEALTFLRAALASATGPSRLAIHRAGRRLARSRRAGWAPDPPLQRPARRTLHLPAAPSSGPRPHYLTPHGPLPVEPAVIALLEAHDRIALHGENRLWTTLFALIFADLYFLPIPGALPCHWLSGPLDVGTPTFRERRADAVQRILDALRAGEGPTRIRAADRQWRGIRLAGADWRLADGETLARIADGLGPHALSQVMEVLLDDGWRAARGLPDLVILPGSPARLPDAMPTQLGPGLLLVEVKGPGDTLRDAQALWCHRLRVANAPIALWEVRVLDGRRT